MFVDGHFLLVLALAEGVELLGLGWEDVGAQDHLPEPIVIHICIG